MPAGSGDFRIRGGQQAVRVGAPVPDQVTATGDGLVIGFDPGHLPHEPRRAHVHGRQTASPHGPGNPGILDAGNNDASGLLEALGCVVFTADGAGSPNSGQVRVIVSWRSLTDTTDAATAANVTCGAVGTGTDAGRQQVVLNGYVVNAGDFAP